MRIVSIVGHKNTGKTSLTVKVIEELCNRGFKVASIKHSHHKMEIDHENKDTWKHKEAGSDLVIGIGERTFFNINETIPLEKLLFLIKVIDDVDFVVIEGFKTYNYAKVCTSPDIEDEYTIAIVDSFTITPDGVSDLVDTIEEKSYDILNTLYVNECGYKDGKLIAQAFAKGDLKYDPDTQSNVSLNIDGINIGLNAFVTDFLKNTILGSLKSLSTEEYGVKDFDKIELVINNKDKE